MKMATSAVLQRTKNDMQRYETCDILKTTKKKTVY